MLNPKPDKYSNVNMIPRDSKRLLCKSDFSLLNFKWFTLLIHKVYKYRKFDNFRMFPSDPKGSLDESNISFLRFMDLYIRKVYKYAKFANISLSPWYLLSGHARLPINSLFTWRSL